MPQLQINQGPQDALLYDNSRSYFTNVGYVRTSNFQVEYRDVEPQNSAQLGSTVQYVIPKAADLLGPVDLCVDLAPPSDWKTTAGDTVASKMEEGKQAWAQWVDEVGFAMIDKVTFSVGSNDIETITGEQLQLKNELMTSDEMRIGHPHILKTGRPHDDFATVTATTTHANGTPLAQFPLPEPSHAKYGVIAAAKCDTGVATDTSRLIAFTDPPAPPTRSNHRDLDRPRRDLDPTSTRPRATPQFRTEINRDLTSDPKIPNWFRPPPTRPSRQIQRSAAAVHTQLQSRRGFHTRVRVSNGLGFGSRQLDARETWRNTLMN